MDAYYEGIDFEFVREDFARAVYDDARTNDRHTIDITPHYASEDVPFSKLEDDGDIRRVANWCISSSSQMNDVRIFTSINGAETAVSKQQLQPRFGLPGY